MIDIAAYKSFIIEGDFSLTSIKRFSANHNIPPYILIGRLQREGIIKYTQYSSEKVMYGH